MPDLIIDGLRVSVPEGTTVIEAAETLGIMIPRLCFHPALGSAGSCRMCAVMFTEGPVKGLEMSCMVKARDGMVVDTGHPEAVAYRKHIAELLMLHHPHDCPVCDEGGHCLLQDVTISCGHSLRRFKGKKRTYRNQDLGPLVAQEMNRCIHCYRCSRYYQDVSGYRDFGPLRISGGVEYGRYVDGPLESPFAGNLLEICPTGVFTDKPSHHKARHWDLERASSVCLSCSLGCNNTVCGRYREVVRLEPRVNHQVNGHFLCDRGRYGYEYANLPERPRTATVDGVELPLHEALAETAARLQALKLTHGAAAVACLGSSRQSIESQGMLASMASMAGWHKPEYSTGTHRKRNILSALAGLSRDLHVSLAGIGSSDCILVLGAAPLSEAPMLALSLRQATRNGALVCVIDPRPVTLPLPFLHIPARKYDMESCLGAIFRKAFPDPGTDALPEEAQFLQALASEMPEAAATPGWEDFAARLAGARMPVIVCGTDIVSLNTPSLAAGAARFLADRLGKAGFFPVFAGANALGAALMNPDPEVSFDDIVDGIDQGRIKALICVESDPLARFANHSRVHEAFEKLELLVCIDHLPSRTRDKARIFLPSQTVFEAGGSFVNQEGRLQYAHPAFASATPLSQSLENGHPPRSFSPEAPGSDPRPSWEILTRLAELSGLSCCPPGETPHPWHGVVSASPVLAALSSDAWPHDGVILLPEKGYGPGLAARPSPPVPDTGADLIITEQAFGTEELSSYGTILCSLAPAPQVVLHSLDATTIELREEDYVHMACEIGAVRCYVRMEENMARSTVVLPRRDDSGWQYATTNGYTVELALLHKHPVDPGKQRAHGKPGEDDA